MELDLTMFEKFPAGQELRLNDIIYDDQTESGRPVPSPTELPNDRRN